jgi:hypothetical protein
MTKLYHHVQIYQAHYGYLLLCLIVPLSERQHNTPIVLVARLPAAMIMLVEQIYYISGDKSTDICAYCYGLPPIL